METFLLRLRDLVWPAVVATVLAGSGVLVAIVLPEKDTLVLALGLASIASSLLAIRD